jgi:hypothetical protein
MSSVPLSADDLRRRVAGTVGKLETGALAQPLMRPERGCVSLVTIRSFSYFASGCLRFSQSGFSLVSRSWCVTSLPCHRSRATRWVAAEKKKEKKDAEKAWARERMRARDALERRRRRQERDGLPREPSPETPDDDDDDDDDEDDDMAARLGLSSDLRLGQGSSTHPPPPPSGLAPLVFGARTSGSRSEE